MRGNPEDSQADPQVHSQAIEALAQTIAQMSLTIERLSAENSALVSALLEAGGDPDDHGFGSLNG